ncbi:MAG TPA: DUF3419 family protein [Candidatus Melainabacteria bacterium]|nr:DUF3419 family protein [Candidatus Melainabacteria bacterium]
MTAIMLTSEKNRSPVCSTEAENWVKEACRKPVAFSQVREDALIDLHIADSVATKSGRQLDGVIVASGGCTVAALAAQGKFRHMQVVDINQSQIALTKLKLWLLENGESIQRMQILGHSPMSPRMRGVFLKQIMNTLELPEKSFGDWSEVCTLGPDYCGKYEAVFAALRKDFEKSGGTIELLLDGDSYAQQTLEHAFARVMSQKNLMAIFGEDATANKARPFWQHFHNQTEMVLFFRSAARNPYLYQMLTGSFPDNSAYPWLSAPSKEIDTDIDYYIDTVSNHISNQPSASLDFVHLSNILDWLPEEAASKLLQQTGRVLRPGGTVIIRQLNSSLDIRAMQNDIAWDGALSRAMLIRDRSFFYRNLHIGFKPCKSGSRS